MNICALIPSYNESQTIAPLVKNVKGYGLDVIVIDDGSSDQTADLAQEAGATVIRQNSNQGKGAALKNGFAMVLEKEYDAVITLDADGQHSPDDLPDFINTYAKGGADIVAGNRMKATESMPLIRWLTNNTMSFFISLLCRYNIPDSQCGYRLIKTNVLKSIALISDNYEIESEMLIWSCRRGFKIKFIPIQTIYAKQRSQINPLIDTIRFFKFLLKIQTPFLFNKK